MPFVSSSGKVFHVDGPGGRRKLEQKAKPLLLGSAVLLCFGVVLRQGSAAASSLVSPAAIKSARRAVQLQGNASPPLASLDQHRAELHRAEVPGQAVLPNPGLVEEEEEEDLAVANTSSLAPGLVADRIDRRKTAAVATNAAEPNS